MQLYAFQSNGNLISTRHAKPKTNYRCLECNGIVRLRGGSHRQKHFFHYQPMPHCHLSAKSMVHLQTQLHIQRLLTNEDCRLEQRFPEIDRIADCFWVSKRIVFEIQCSSIAWEEVERRVIAYRSIGCEIVWILHDRLFNQFRMGRAEMWLRTNVPTYFTNMDKEGKGNIYDQWEVLSLGLRRSKSGRFPVDITEPIYHFSSSMIPALLIHRQKRWPLYFAGDLVERVLCEPQLHDEISEIEQSHGLHKTPLIERFRNFIGRMYRIFFRLYLERACR